MADGMADQPSTIKRPTTGPDGAWAGLAACMLSSLAGMLRWALVCSQAVLPHKAPEMFCQEHAVLTRDGGIRCWFAILTNT
jgi:hypothetical protein